MKKVLLATTALALSAGVASAEIKLGGYANMGLSYTGAIAGSPAVQGEIDADALTALQALLTPRTNDFQAWNQGVVSGAPTTGSDIQAIQDEIAAVEAQIAADALAGVAADPDLAADLETLQDALAAFSGTAAVADAAATTTFVQRMEFNVDASTETTSGITFGARTRVRVNAGETGVFSGTRVYMSTGGFEVAMGNIGGAIWTIPGVWASEVGLVGMSDAGVVFNTVANPATAWGTHGFSSQGAGANGIEVSYSGGGFSGRLAYSDEDTSGGVSSVQRTSAHASYTMGDWTATIAMQDSSVANEDKTILVVDGKVGDVGLNFAAADNNGETKIALTGSVTMGATTVHGFVADEESGDNLALGLNVAHDIGGAAIIAAFERDAVGVNRAEAGVSFSF